MSQARCAAAALSAAAVAAAVDGGSLVAPDAPTVQVAPPLDLMMVSFL